MSKPSDWRNSTRVPVTLAPLIVLLFVVACQRDAVAPGRSAPVQPLTQSLELTEWSEPVNFGPRVNSAFAEQSPILSNDGLSLYFASNRPGGFGANDIWVSQRPSTDAPWGIPRNLGEIVNTASTDFGPQLSRNGHQLYFVSGRPGGYGGQDLWVSWRANTHDDFAWETPVNLGPVINTVADEGTPSIQGNEFYFARSRGGITGPPFDIYVSTMRGDTFEPAQLVTELNSPTDSRVPKVRFDGREIFFTSDRPGGVGSYDIWRSTRQGNGQTWSPPENLGPVINSSRFDIALALSEDGTTLFFSSDRPGGFGSYDLYYATRSVRPH